MLPVKPCESEQINPIHLVIFFVSSSSSPVKVEQGDDPTQGFFFLLVVTANIRASRPQP